MAYKKFDRPPLEGLRPGQPARPEGEFKVRGECPVHGKGSCGTVAVQCRHDWSSLTYYPHHRNGRPDLYAFRQAFLHHLGQVEAIFASLKGAHGQGTPGADRGRVRKRATHEALISLALLSHMALAVADVRLQRGLALDQRPTPDDDQPTGGAPASGAGAAPAALNRARAAGGPPPRASNAPVARARARVSALRRTRPPWLRRRWTR